MNTIVRKVLALITVAFFTFSSPSPVSLYAWPWSKAPNNDTQGNDLSTTANINGSASGGTASGRASAQASGSNFNASGDALVGTNIRQGVAGAEVRGQASSNIGGIPANATGSASTMGRGTIDSSGRPSVDFQTQTNLTGSVGGRYGTQGSGSASSAPYAQTSVSRTSQSGNVSFNASASAGSFNTQGNYSATADSSGAGVDARGNLRATLVEAEVRTHYQTGMGRSTVDVTAGGRTTIGLEATGTGHASIDRRGVSAGGSFDAMAGARQRADVGGTLNILGLIKITTRVEGEIIEGGGLKAHANLQASTRGLAISAGLAAAPGAGAGLTTEFEIDVSGITEPIGKAIDATVGAIGRGAKSLWDKLFGKKEEKEGEAAAAACAAQGDNVFCTGGAAGGGPRPNPQPDPAEEARRREQERRREREERRREEQERKRREREEKEEQKRREKEERKQKGEETWRKLPPLPKPQTGGATGRTFDPETGEITEGIMDPEGNTTITKKDHEGNIISVEERGRHPDQAPSSAESESSSTSEPSDEAMPLAPPEHLQAGPEDGFTQVPDVRKLAAQKYARVDHDLDTDNLVVRDLYGNILGVVQKGNLDLKALDMEDRLEKFSRMSADDLKKSMRDFQEQEDRAQNDMIGIASEIHIAKQKLDKLEEQKQNAKRMGFDTTTIDGKIEQVKGEIKSAEYRVQDAGDRAENARRNMQAADQRLSQLKSLKTESSQSKAQVQVPNRVTTNRPSDSSSFDAFDAMQGGGMTMLTHQKTTPTAVLDGAPNSRDMNPGTLTVDRPAEADGYKSGPEC